MQSVSQPILTPVGRIVEGNLYKPNTTDAEGRPLVIKSGPNAGQPRKDYYFAIAIPKGTEPHWAHTPWGQIIWNVAHQAWPGGQTQARTFAWKVSDGDSQEVNTKGKRPCDDPNKRGHWILKFSSGFAPKIHNADGTQQITEPDAVKPGYFVQVYGTVDTNGSVQKPGIFLNHHMVALAGYGQEIVSGPDASAVGFGKGAALPAGASPTPLAGSFNPAPAMPAPGAVGSLPALPTAVPGAAAPLPSVGIPQVPGMPLPTAPTVVPQVAPVMQQPAALPAIPVVPNPGFLGVPAAPRWDSVKANGATYDQFKAAGWTDDQMRQAGYLS